ncbi:MAG: hypothetical protein ACXV5N_07530 [Halobacteriota archaeon]
MEWTSRDLASMPEGRELSHFLQKWLVRRIARPTRFFLSVRLRPNLQNITAEHACVIKTGYQNDWGHVAQSFESMIEFDLFTLDDQIRRK